MDSRPASDDSSISARSSPHQTWCDVPCVGDQLRKERCDSSSEGLGQCRGVMKQAQTRVRRAFSSQ
jgi:hypothetical protein